MSEFIDSLPDLFAEFGPIAIRRMFGGCGVFCDGLMFAIVVDDVLYLKADAESEPEFAAAGLEPFVYERLGKPVKLSFWRAPDELLDDREVAAERARRALAAARRAQAVKRR